EPGHQPDHRFGELADPAVCDQADRDGVQVVVFFPTDPPRLHQARFFQDAERAHDADPGHRRQVPAELAEGLAIALEQSIEQEPPTRIAQGPEDLPHLRHPGTTCDSYITYH